MRSTLTALGLALALVSVNFSAPADAQRMPGARKADRDREPQQPAQEGAIAPSKEAHKAILELQEAVNANDVANIPAKLAAAEAVATTEDDRYLIASLRFKAAVAAKDEAAKIAALETMAALGKIPANQLAAVHTEIGVAAYNSKQFDKAAAAFEKALLAEPNKNETKLLLAQTRSAQGKPQEALALLKQAMAQSKAAGITPSEKLYEQMVALAYDARQPEAIELSRQWVMAYPTSDNWRDAIRIYRNLARPDEAVLLDLLRLGRATSSLEGAADYHPYGFAAVQDLAPAEAKAVVEEGIAAGKINGSDKTFRDILAEASTKSAGQKERLPALEQDALASPNAKMAVTAGNIHYGNGDYAKAAELYRAALGKAGVDKDLVNLRLGMSLARAGDKAGATAALNAVTGERADVAKYWLVYVQTRG